MTARAAAAVDIGGTTIKGALIADDGTILARARRATTDGDALAAVRDVLGSLADRSRAAGVELAAAGLVSPGIVDETRGVVAFSANLGWRDVPLGDEAARVVGVPVAIGQDVRAAGLAEHRLGAARDVDDVILVPIGTGIAGAVISGGRVVVGATGAAGEFGHMPVVPDGEPCPCGQRGCLEVYSSAAGIARRYAAATGVARSSQEIAARLDADPAARAVWDEAVRMLACAFASVTLQLDPQAIVVAGGLSLAGETLLGPLRAELDARLAWRAAPAVRASTLGMDAGVRGAALLAFDAIGHPLRRPALTAAR